MIHPSQIPVLIADSKTCAFVSDYLTAHGLRNLCDFKQDNSISGIQLGVHSFPKSARIGLIIDILNSLHAKNGMQKDCLTFYGGILDVLNSVFVCMPESREVRLTEKEVAILVYLHKNKGQIVSRKDLLSAVWEYAENVETHTLETHIYRLRQKIESDPSAPTILLTEESGYRVL